MGGVDVVNIDDCDCGFGRDVSVGMVWILVKSGQEGGGE